MRYTTTTNYERLRLAGNSAASALRGAKILERWTATNHRLVKLDAQAEQEGYFSVYGEPAGYVDIYGQRHSDEQEREEICDSIERNGCWIVSSFWRPDEDSEWQIADSIGMCTGYENPLSPYENAYILDLMASALNALENAAIAPAL